MPAKVECGDRRVGQRRQRIGQRRFVGRVRDRDDRALPGQPASRGRAATEVAQAHDRRPPPAIVHQSNRTLGDRLGKDRETAGGVDRFACGFAAGWHWLCQCSAETLAEPVPPRFALRLRFRETRCYNASLHYCPPTRPGKAMRAGPIVLRGVRVHNLKSIDLDIPRQKLIVLCGLSGSGKSSLALDTLYAEGQRRYIESFSAYTRQFLQRLEKPDAELIDNIPPAIAVTSKNAGQSSRSTVGTATETADYLRLLFAKIGRIHCRNCGQEVRCDGPQSVAARIAALPPGKRCMIAFAVDPPAGSDTAAVLAALREEGFVRAIVDGRMVDIDGASRDAAGQAGMKGLRPRLRPLFPPTAASMLSSIAWSLAAPPKIASATRWKRHSAKGRAGALFSRKMERARATRKTRSTAGSPHPGPLPEGEGDLMAGSPRPGPLPAGKGGRLPSTAGRGGDSPSARD